MKGFLKKARQKKKSKVINEAWVEVPRDQLPADLEEDEVEQVDPENIPGFHGPYDETFNNFYLIRGGDFLVVSNPNNSLKVFVNQEEPDGEEAPQWVPIPTEEVDADGDSFDQVPNIPGLFDDNTFSNFYISNDGQFAVEVRAGGETNAFRKNEG